MIEKLAEKGADFLVRKTTRPVSRDVLRFGMHTFMQLQVKITVWLLAGLMINRWLEWTAILLGFSMTRVIIGGVHAKTFSRCVVWSLSTLSLSYFLYILVITNFSGPYQQQTILMLVSIVFFFIVWDSGIPIRWGKRKYSKQRIRLTKITFCIYFAFICLLLFQHTSFTKALACGMLTALLFSLPFIKTQISKIET